MTLTLANSIEIAADPRVGPSAQRWVSATLEGSEISRGARADVELLVGELLLGVLRHGDARMVNIEVVVVAGAVTVTLSGGISEASSPLVGPAGEGGAGLVTLDSMTSAWGTRRTRGETSVWFTVVDADAAPDRENADVGGDAPMEVPATAAGAVLDEAFAVVLATTALLTADPEQVASRAAVAAEQAALVAAAKTADAAQRARVARAGAALEAAAAVADAAARAAEAVQAHADDLASVVVATAALAAEAVSQSIGSGGDAEAVHAAREVHAAAATAATATAEETARAAVVVARAVAAAASVVAGTSAAAAAAAAEEVLQAADAMRAIVDATARDLASDALERRAAAALGAQAAVVASDIASEGLHEANEQLRRASLHDRAVALELQQAMLTRLPEAKDLQLAARYLCAAEHDQVGGDWYDALIMPAGTTTLLIGDVIGHDIHAAAMMGQLRNILRTLIWERHHSPADVISRLDRVLRDLDIDTLASLIVVNVEPSPPDDPTSVATLRWSNAGHPAPVLVHADGTAVMLEETTDVLVGMCPDIVRRDHTHPVPPGSTVVLYTDGLVETRTDPIDIGQLRLLDAVRTHHHREPGDLLDAVLEDMLGNLPSDDVALLAVRFQTTLIRPRQSSDESSMTPPAHTNWSPTATARHGRARPSRTWSTTRSSRSTGRG